MSFFLLQTFCLIKELNWGLQPRNQVPRKLQTFVDLFKKERNSEGYLFSFHSFFKMSKSWGLHWPEGYCTSQEHYSSWVTGFPIRKLIVVPLTFFGIFATFFGNNFPLLQRLPIRKLLLDGVILPSC